MNKLSLIKAEIERLYKEAKEEPYTGRMEGRLEALDKLDAFIDALEEEPVSEDLEQAAVEAFKHIVDSDKNNFYEIFKAGANWQKERDFIEMPEALRREYERGAKDTIDEIKEILN